MVEITEEPEERHQKGSGDDSAEEKEEKENNDSSSSWTKLMGDNIQMKPLQKPESTNTTNKGKGVVECQPQDAAVIDFVGRFAPTRDDEDGPIFHEAKDCLIVVGEKYVNPALEMGVRFMHEGQSVILWSHSKFAYGLSTRKWNDGYELPPNSNVRYEITLKSIYSPNEESTDPDGFQLKLAMSKKLIANDMFKNELYNYNNSNNNNSNQISEQRALRLYNKATEEMLHLLQTHASRKEQNKDDNYKEDEHKNKIQQATEIMLDCLNNVVAVYLKARKYHEAKDAAIKVLTHDPNNYKALLRAAKAAMLDPAGTYEESDVAISAAEKVVAEDADLDDKDVRKLRQELKQKKLQYKKRQKEMMARMTKELKPKKDQQQQPSTTTKVLVQEEEEEEEGASQQSPTTMGSDQTTTSKGTGVEEEQDEEVHHHSLWRRLLPYVIQIIFPFILYYTVTMTSSSSSSSNNQHLQQHTNIHTTTADSGPPHPPPSDATESDGGIVMDDSEF